jgi:hypothetical protein
MDNPKQLTAKELRLIIKAKNKKCQIILSKEISVKKEKLKT